MTPDELEKLPKPLERTMTALELSIMAEIVQRIKEAAQITPVTDWLILRLTLIGKSKSQIKRLIGRAIEKVDLQVDEIYKQVAESDYIRNREIYQKSGQDYMPYEDNKWLQQVVDAARRQTKGSLRPMENITQTTGFNVPVGGGKKVFTPLSEYLERSLDKAVMGIATGTKTYSQAVGDVIDEMTASGVRTVEYASGKSDRVEVAARRAVMTGVAQMTDKVNEKNAEELGTDHWEVDWHMGARNTGTGYLNHQSWQGKVYSSEEMRVVCGLGEMLGFAGINCYHIRFPFLPGISKRKYTDEWLAEQNRRENEKKTYRGREYDTYGALQYQRRLERTIRKQKQEIELLKTAEADKADLTAAKSRLRLTDKTYVDFSKEMGLSQQRERLRIANNSIDKGSNRGIIESNRSMSNGQRTSPHHVLSPEEKQSVLTAARDIELPQEVLEFNAGTQTGFNDLSQKIYIRGDVLPDLSSTNLRDNLSVRAVLAHEYYGHYKNHPSSFRIGEWRDEFRASYCAAVNTPGLGDEERRMLMLDAYDRAREAGVPVTYNKNARRIIYGYE